MIVKTTHATLIVPNQEEALQYYVETLGLVMRFNDPFPGDDSRRWITVAPVGQTELEIVLEPPSWRDADEAEAKQNQIGSYPGFVFNTDDCKGDVAAFEAKGVKIISQPEQLPWGISAMIEDKYGYQHNLLQLTAWEGNG